MLRIEKFQILSKKDRKEDNVYAYIFFLFKLIGINEIHQTKYDKENKRVSSTSNVFYSIFTAIVGISISISSISQVLFSDNILFGKIAKVIMFSVSLSCRVYLCKHFKELQRLWNKINDNSSTNLQRRSIKILRINTWCFIVTFSLTLISFNRLNNDKVIQHLLLGYKIGNDTLRSLFAFFYSLCSCCFMHGPLNIFAIYYASLCYEIKNRIQDYHAVIKTCHTRNYNELSDAYCKIRLNAKLIDAKVRFLVFISFIFNAMLMFLGITILLYLNEDSSLMITFLVLTFCFIMLLNFLIQVLYASLINDASLRVRDETKAIKNGNTQSDSSCLRFFLTCEDEISLTVWGITDMKRSFIFGTIGTILTYSLLVDSLMKHCWTESLKVLFCFRISGNWKRIWS